MKRVLVSALGEHILQPQDNAHFARPNDAAKAGYSNFAVERGIRPENFCCYCEPWRRSAIQTNSALSRAWNNLVEHSLR